MPFHSMLLVLIYLLIAPMVLARDGLPSTTSGFKSVWHHVGTTPYPVGHQSPEYKPGVFYAQLLQDKLITFMMHEMGEDGKQKFFVDLAANHGTFISNTAALEFSNWDGLCIEANPIYSQSLRHRKCTNVMAVVSAKDNEVVEFAFGQKGKEYLGGIKRLKKSNSSHGEEFDQQKEHGATVHEFYAVSLETLFKFFKVPAVIDYFSLDIEGAEQHVMSTFPFDKYTFRVMNIERPKEHLRKQLEENGYEFWLYPSNKNFGDSWWVHKSVSEKFPKLREDTIKFNDGL